MDKMSGKTRPRRGFTGSNSLNRKDPDRLSAATRQVVGPVVCSCGWPVAETVLESPNKGETAIDRVSKGNGAHLRPGAYRLGVPLYITYEELEPKLGKDTAVPLRIPRGS